jgi:hypothetical protein
MINKSFDEIVKNDIDVLIDDQVSEIKQLEYKKELSGGTDKEKAEFLSDVSSFANASGGHIIYGLGDKKDTVGKKTGTPEYVGLGTINVDEQKLRLEHMILNGIEPRITGIQIKAVEGFDNGPVIVIWIPQSWVSPHMVKHNNRFYSRTSSGKYPLDVQEIREAFAQSEALPERIRKFRLQRIEKVIENDTPVHLLQGLKYILHIIPFDAFKAGVLHDLSPFVLPGKEKLPLVFWGGQIRTRYNFEGVVASRMIGTDWKGQTYAYTQLFRNGIIEGVWMPYNPKANGNVEKSICVEYEASVVSSIKEFLSIQKTLGVAPPICVMISFLEVKDCLLTEKISPGYNDSIIGGFSIKEERLLLPEVIFESFEVDILKEMKPIFDIVLNAAGVSRAEIE